MEFERSLFRIYERVLTSENFFLWTKIVIIFCLTFSGLSLFCLLFFHIGYINNGEILSSAISKQLLNDSSIYRSDLFNLTLRNNDMKINPINTTLLPEDIYNISIGAVNYQFCQYYQILFLPYDIKIRKNIKEHVIKLNYEDIMPSYLWPLIIIYNELDTILINQIAAVFDKEPGSLKNLNTEETWGWKKGDFRSASSPSIFMRISNLFSGIFCFLLISLVSGLICRIAIAGSAGIMISLSWCMTLLRTNENTRMILFFAFPWAGQPAYILRNIGKGIFPLVFSFFIMLIVFYFMYACTNIIWNQLVFGYTYPKGIDEKLYTMFSILEFFSMIFVRTKKTVNVFPKIVTVLLCSFIIYRNNNFYPFVNTFFVVVSFGLIASMVLVIKFIEKPIFTNEGPSFESPRLVYQPVFNRNNTALPEIWTTFYMVAGRGFFTEQQMSSIFPRQGPL